MQQNTLLPPAWNSNSKHRQEKIAQRLAKNQSKNQKFDIDAVRSRRARLEDWMKTLKGRDSSSAEAKMTHSAGQTNVKLTPIQVSSAQKPENRLTKKPRQVRSSSPLLESRKYEEQLLEEWRKRRVMGDDVRRSSFQNVFPSRRGSEVSFAAQFRRNSQQATEVAAATQQRRRSSRSESSRSTDDDRDSESDRNQSDSDSDDNVNDKTVREIVRQMRARTEDERLTGAQRARRHLSVEQNPPLDKYIDAGAIPALVSCLSTYSAQLQFEAVWALTNITAGNSEQAIKVYEAGSIPKLVQLLGSPYSYVVDQCVWALGNLAGDGSFLWQSVVDEGAIKALHQSVQKSPSLPSFRNLSWAFGNIVRHKPLNLSVSDFDHCLKAVRLFLHQTDKEIYQNACWSLVYITDNDDKIEEVVRAGLLPRVTELLESSDKTTVSPAIRLIGNIMTGNDQQTDEALKGSALPILIQHLDHPSCNIRKDSAWALSNVTAGSETQVQRFMDAGGLRALIPVVGKDDPKVRKEAIWCASNLTQSGNADQVTEAIESGLLEALAASLSAKPHPADAQQVHVTLEGLKNMIVKSHDASKVAKLLSRDVPKSELERLCREPESAVRRAAVRLNSLVAERARSK